VIETCVKSLERMGAEKRGPTLDAGPLLFFSSDRSRHDTEPLRDWRRSSVLLHSPIVIQANAK